MTGVIVLFLAWFFLVRPSAEPTRAVPIRVISETPTITATSAPAPSSPTPQPSRTPTRSSSPTPTPTPTQTPTPTPTPTPTDGLNDASNRLGWSFLIDGLGPVKLGLDWADAVELGVLQQVPSACSSQSPTDLLGDVRVYASGGRVSAIDIRSAAFPSGRGIRIGATLADLKSAYGSSLKSTGMTDGGARVTHWAITSPNQYIAYLVDDAGIVNRIAIGYRSADDSITLPPPC